MTEPRHADEGAERLVGALLDAAGRDQIRAVLLFGSRMVQASPDRYSAYDLVVVVERYRPFYEALVRAGLSSRSPALQSALNRVLAPNVIAVAPDGWENGPVAKIMVLEPDAFALELSPRSPDHFLKGRLIQKVAVLHAREDRALAWVEGLLEEARGGVLGWAGPSLGASFTVTEAGRRMLQRSYAAEVRPEAGDRVLEVFESQRPFLEASLTRVLEREVAGGLLARDGERYRFVRPPDARHERRVRLYFLRSKARATARWLKHMATFDNWLDYIARKVERRTGMRVEITPWERRLPYLLLWPKVARVLRARPAQLRADDRSARGAR